MLQKAHKFLLFFLLVVGYGLAAQNASIPPQPNPPRLVTDFTMTLSQEEVNALEQKLKAYSDSTSSQIAIVVVKNIGDYDIADYAVDLATSWGIGVQGKNNGILILWATGNRKIYIATGYGMEEKVPDAIAKRIVNQLIIPSFREGRYYQGLNLATDEIMARMSGTYQADDVEEGEGSILPFLIMMLIFMIVFFYIINKNRGKGNRFNDRNRGGFGGWGGGIYPPWTIGHGGGYSGGWDSDNSGGWGGGGFGGFGGGDFGGGGAGGDY